MSDRDWSIDMDGHGDGQQVEDLIETTEIEREKQEQTKETTEANEH